MKNLLLLQHMSRPSKTYTEGARLLTINQNKRMNAFVATATHVVRIDLEENDDEQIHELTSAVVDIQHLALNDELCLATEEGDVLVLNLQTKTTESVGYCAGGIARMVWSPDQEVVTFVTLEGRLVVMDSLYSPMAECVLSESGFGDGAFVNVGWGAKETQFHGTEGKAARHIKANQGVVLNAEHVDRTVSIVWRGDSELFAVSFVSSANREFKVFDKEGNLKFTSEPTLGLEAAICWRPSGTWIAIPQTLSNKYVIALFEKNGLRHREIVLPFASQTEVVVRIEFSEDSDVLAVQTMERTTESSRIYLFTICNYHWYQKQTLLFDSPVKAFAWDPCFTESKQLHVVTQDGGYGIYRWDWAVATSKTFSREDHAMVAVIDGSKLLLTAFRGGVVPPPMCSLEVVCDHPINWVDFLHYPDRPEEANHFMIVDAANTISFYSSQFEKGLLKSVELISKTKIPVDEISIKFSHWIWLSPNTIIASCTEATLNSRLFLVTLTPDYLDLNQSTILTGQVSRICAISPDSLQVATSKSSLRIQLPTLSITVCPSLVQSDLVENLCSASNQLIFFLKHRHWLYCNDKCIATDVTSMFLTADYLVFTKLDRLYFVRLVDKQIVGERRIERGARLVVVVPKDCRTVLQMPRGNLEVIQPRVLSICIIGEFLASGDYYAAFDLMRKQRINLNLIVDHQPALFYEQIDGFVEAISNPNWLNLFLTDLEEADVTVTMYGSNYPGRSAATGPRSASKVEMVCQRIVEAIHRLGKSDQLVLPILTTHVKQKQLEEALLYVWNRKISVEGEFDANAALSYLLYLVDVNEMYNVALGTYNFELVKFVAGRSQKDPREYLPFLDTLQRIEDVDYRYYSIDKYLKRFAKAIGHIVKCGVDRVDEALEVVVDHSLYRKAMDAYEKQGNQKGYQLVCHSFAEYLREKGRIREACLMYERSGDLKQALMSARHILDWQKCISLGVGMKQSEEEVEKLVRSLVPALVDGGKHQDAADMLIAHLADYGAAIPIMCDAKMYATALYLARIHAEHLVAPFIREHLSAHAAQTHQILLSDQHQFLEHKARLLAIRIEKQARKAAAAAQDDAHHPGGEHDDADMFSDTSSMNSSRFSASSRGTAKTHKSSRNRRKHQRKLLNLKPGNAFEDIALIDALHTAAVRAFDQQTVVRGLFKAMIDLAMDAEAVPIQVALKDLLCVIRDSLDEIWIPEMVVSGQPQTAEDGPIDFGQKLDEEHYAMIEPHQRYKPQLKAIDWEYEILDCRF